MMLLISGIIIEVNKNNVKTLRLYVKPPDGKVTVSAPLSMSNTEIEYFVHSKIDWIKKHIARFENHPQKTSKEFEDKKNREEYRRQLTAEIERLLPKWEKKTGLKCENWKIRYMTSRWGSCKIKKRHICFNLQLAKKPPECLEYIILHELIHFKERYHNERFYSLMGKYMPKWKKIKAVLNK